MGTSVSLSANGAILAAGAPKDNLQSGVFTGEGREIERAFMYDIGTVFLVVCPLFLARLPGRGQLDLQSLFSLETCNRPPKP